MKKHLMLFPLVASVMALGSCKFTFSDFIGLFKEKDKSETETKTDALQNLIDSGYAIEEYEGYTICGKPKDGGKYILGIYRNQYDEMRFVNGDYHTDKGKEYEFYMSTSEGSPDEAAEIKIHYVDDDTFTMQVLAPGKDWDNKYIGIYAATSSYGNDVWSIAHLDEEDQTQYIPTGATDSVRVYSEFTYLDTYNDEDVATAACMVADERNEEDEETPKMLGTGYNDKEVYISMDCTSYGKALDHNSYDLMHFYKKA